MPRPHEAEAQAQPDIAFGWIYAVDGEFGAGDPIPAAAIIGAWETDGHGNPAGEFLSNPNYVPREPEPPCGEPLPAAVLGQPLV